MSDSYLRIVPQDPTFVPETSAVVAGEALLRTIAPEVYDISSETPGEVQFVDCGDGFDHVLCPECGYDLALRDVWSDLMDQSYETRFTNLVVQVPCCGRSVSLNDLKHEAPCAFASYILEARSQYFILADSQIAALATALGCDVRVIWAHY